MMSRAPRSADVSPSQSASSPEPHPHAPLHSTAPQGSNSRSSADRPRSTAVSRPTPLEAVDTAASPALPHRDCSYREERLTNEICSRVLSIRDSLKRSRSWPSADEMEDEGRHVVEEQRPTISQRKSSRTASLSPVPDDRNIFFSKENSSATPVVERSDASSSHRVMNQAAEVHGIATVGRQQRDVSPLPKSRLNSETSAPLPGRRSVTSAQAVPSDRLIFFAPVEKVQETTVECAPHTK